MSSSGERRIRLTLPNHELEPIELHLVELSVRELLAALSAPHEERATVRPTAF
jgi:hypothetical protein